jgi:hypothetical protein
MSIVNPSVNRYARADRHPAHHLCVARWMGDAHACTGVYLEWFRLRDEYPGLGRRLHNAGLRHSGFDLNAATDDNPLSNADNICHASATGIFHR